MWPARTETSRRSRYSCGSSRVRLLTTSRHSTEKRKRQSLSVRGKLPIHRIIRRPTSISKESGRKRRSGRNRPRTNWLSKRKCRRREKARNRNKNRLTRTTTLPMRPVLAIRKTMHPLLPTPHNRQLKKLSSKTPTRQSIIASPKKRRVTSMQTIARAARGHRMRILISRATWTHHPLLNSNNNSSKK